jgi:glyoxylase-like metal-dependent hydrolase (beta-lactamase superfamily II)
VGRPPREIEQLSEHLYLFRDTCNVYVIRDGDACLLIDTGSGAITDHLPELGIEQVEWILHTHHHRDQCFGTPKLQERGARVAVPEYERHLFDRAESYWQTRRTYDNYDDRNTFFTVATDICVDAALEDYEEFTWRSHRFLVLPAKGHTFGSSALIAEIDGKRIAFTGDLISASGKLYQLHAMEYTYGAMEGILFTIQSIRALRARELDLILPSHGDSIADVRADIDKLEQRLMDCARLGTGMLLAPRAPVPETSYLPDGPLQQISRHLLWGGIWTCANFYVLLSDTGKALFIDYGHSFYPHMHIHSDHEGLDTMRFVEHSLTELQERYGVTQFDLVLPTHIHDDHTCGIPYLQRHHGVRCWALDCVADVLEHPAAWASTPCVFPKPIAIERRLGDGETVQWEEYSLTVHHAPGQAEFHSTIVTEVDGRTVAFTGDNYFLHDVTRSGALRRLPFQTTVLRNSFQLAMHRRCAEVMRLVEPELICPGHGEVLQCTKEDIDTYCDFIERKERVFRELVNEPADHYIDLFWARLLPYRVDANPGETIVYTLRLRNNLEREAMYSAKLLLPDGWAAGQTPDPLMLPPGESGELALAATAPDAAERRRRLVTAEVFIDELSQGPLCEALVSVVPR